MKLALIAASALPLILAMSPARAMVVPTPTAPDSGIIDVRQGCGPYGHRDYYGRCAPNARPFFRRCPPGLHPTPYGCRPNF